jgi:hypothetical protein
VAGESSMPLARKRVGSATKSINGHRSNRDALLTPGLSFKPRARVGTVRLRQIVRSRELQSIAVYIFSRERPIAPHSIDLPVS